MIMINLITKNIKSKIKTKMIKYKKLGKLRELTNKIKSKITQIYHRIKNGNE